VTQAADTLTERAVEALQRDILAGALAPGARLPVHDLAARYAIGVTPLREALSRLAALGLVSDEQRGFRVAEVSRDDLADITRARQGVEAAALRAALAEGDAEWEAGIVAARHLLRRCAEGSASPSGANPAFDAAHKRFHVALLAGCHSPRLLRLQSSLYDEAYRYRRVMMARFEGWAAFLRAHDELAARVMARDAKGAHDMLMAHLGSTLAAVYPAEQEA
jgi:GntR family transcriptional regulator, carbon starvation induced regulator